MKKNQGFTLFELLVVISIIGILLGLVMTSFSSAQKRARDARRKEDLQELQKALEQYYALSGSYPSSCYTSGILEYDGTTLMNNFPTDPKGGDDYSYSATNCSSNSYCYCAHLESTTDAGNSTDNACNWGSGAYFCISNRQ